MSHIREIAFIDPGIANLSSFLSGLRSEVAPIVLGATRPAARQIAGALASTCNLQIVHVVAHGEPGRVIFGGGHWRKAALEEQANDLASVGRALGQDGGLCLWSCSVAASAFGQAFVDTLEDATGTVVAAAHDRVGHAAQRGIWRLSGHFSDARPPLTSTGMATYYAVLASEITVVGKLPIGNTTQTVTYFIVDTATHTIAGQVFLPDAVARPTSVSIAVQIQASPGSLAIGTFASDGTFRSVDFLTIRSLGGSSVPTGAVGSS